LPAHKNTPEIAAIRQLEPYTTVHSPSAHSTFSDPHGLILFIDQLRRLSGGKPVGIKLCIGVKSEFEEMVNLMAATGIYPDFITVDGAEGGTGAAPLEFMDHVGLTLNEAVPFVSATLKYYGLREKVRVIASGKIISAFDMAKQLASGADLCYSARGMMFALGCIQALQCDKDSCPVGVATQNIRLANGLNVADKRVRVKNFHTNTLKALADLMGASGFEKPEDINPAQFFKRISSQEIVSFDKLNEQIQPSGQKYAFKNFTNN
jgi:glutamate synthase domain-containing protein 2